MPDNKGGNAAKAKADCCLLTLSPRPTITYARSTDSPDLRVKALEEHEESVYAVAWSAADPFLFASASYDGRVVVNAVPPSEKYKILL